MIAGEEDVAISERLNLVTGACGFSGSHLVKHLLDEGQRVIATDLAASFEDEKNVGIFRSIGPDFSHEHCTVIPSDLTDIETLRPLFERPITHVFHTASLYNYSARMDVLQAVNIGGFQNLLDAMEDVRIERFVHWSTCGVFGHPYPLSAKGKGNLPFTEDSSSPKNQPFESGHPEGTYIVNDYSVTKWKQEQMAWRACREKGLPLTVIRPAPIYGPGSRYGHGGIVLTIHKGLVPFIPRDAHNYITTSVHVDDLTRFAYYISNRDDAIGEDFNVVDNSIISYAEFLHYIALLVGRRMFEVPFIRLTRAKYAAKAVTRMWRVLTERWGVPYVSVFEVGSAPYIGSSYWLSNKKTRDWGFEYKYPNVRDGLRDTIQWFREVGWL